MVKIYIANTDMSGAILLPITPSIITVRCGTTVRQYETASHGIITEPGNSEPAGVTFSSFFPANHRSYSLNNSMYGMSYVDAIIAKIKARKPCRVVIVGMNFDRDMIIEKFDYSADRGKDIRYTLSLTERRGVNGT